MSISAETFVNRIRVVSNDAVTETLSEHMRGVTIIIVNKLICSHGHYTQSRLTLNFYYGLDD